MADRKIEVFLNIIVLIGIFKLSMAGIQSAQAIPPSNYIFVTYLPQETSYYCGPATVQMVLSYIDDTFPSQNQLAKEMQTDPVKGITYTAMMRIPFENRGFIDVNERSLELNDLKAHNYNGHLTIILIYFSATHEYQHYVLVIGYNISGIFVHDPWPTSWNQPEGRTTGADAFISNEQLTDLWACQPSHWGLVIPYSEKSVTPVAWWQQHWYILLAVPVVVAGVLITWYIKMKRKNKFSTDEKFK